MSKRCCKKYFTKYWRCWQLQYFESLLLYL